MPREFYVELPETKPSDEPEMAYIEMPTTDEHGNVLPPALVAAGGDVTALAKPDLVNFAATRNVPTEGTKADIIAALTAADNPGAAGASDKEN